MGLGLGSRRTARAEGGGARPSAHAVAARDATRCGAALAGVGLGLGLGLFGLGPGFALGVRVRVSVSVRARIS